MDDGDWVARGLTPIVFLGEFALAEGKKGGQFYTPGSISGATQTGTTKTWPASVIQRPRIKKNLSRIKV